MHLYLTSSQLPEMATLTKAQRRFVREECLLWLRRGCLFRVGSTAITVGPLILATYAADAWKWGIWTSAGLAAASVGVLGCIYDMIWLAHWRPEVGRFIQKHAAELQAAA